MKIRKRVRLNTSFATKAISDRFPHFGATKIGDSGRHGNPHFSVFYTRFAAQSGYISFERRKCPIARRRIPLNRSTSGVRAPPAAFSSRRPCPRRADDPSGGRRSDGGKDAEGRVRNGRPTILPRPDGKRPVRPRIPARRQRSGAPKRSSVPQKRRTSLPADELHIARDIGGGRSPAGARPPRGRETSAPTSDPEYRLRGDTRRPTGRVLHNPEISPFLYSGIGFVPFRSRRGAASERSYLRKRLSRERVPVRRPLSPDCLVHRPGTDTSQRAGLRRGGGLPKPAASDRTTIPPVRPRPTVLYRTRRRSRHFCRRASPSATQRTFHPSYRRTRAFDDRQTAPPSFAPSERKSSIREEGTAPPDTVSIRSGALPPSSPSARRFGLRFKQSGKNKSKPPAPYHRRLSRSRPSMHTRPRPVTSNGKQRKQGRPTNLLPPLPENLLFGGKYENCTDRKEAV